LALKRLGASARLEECLFVTENAAHITATRALGMDTLQFGTALADGFSDWTDGLLKIAMKFDPLGETNLPIALAVLGRAEGLEEFENVTLAHGRIAANVKAWLALDDASLGDLEGVYVPVPATVEVELSGDTPHLDVKLPEDANAEATAFVRSLQARGKIEGAAKSLLGPPTHVVVTDKMGRRVLKRRGFD
jgi:hypothetical protein